MCKNMMIGVFTIALCLSLGVTVFASETTVLRFEIGNPIYLANGIEQEIIDGVVPFIDEEAGRTMLPLTTVAGALGASVDWDEETRTATIIRGAATLIVPIDEELPDDMGVPVIVDGRTFVPLTYFANELGATTRWDEDAYAVYVYDAARAEVTPIPAPGVYDIPQEEVTPMPMPTVDPIDTAIPPALEGLSAYELLDLSSELMIEAGSVLMTTETDMIMMVDGITIATQMTGTIAQVIHSEVDMDMRMEMETSVMGMTETTVSYFRDGVLYMDMLGEWVTMEIPIEDILAQTGLISFPEDAIVFQSVAGTGDGVELSFILSGDMLQDVIDPMTEMFGDMGLEDIDMDFGDMYITVILDAEGNMLAMVVSMEYSINAAGELISVSMVMISEVVQFGGVTITFPAALDAAVEA